MRVSAALCLILIVCAPILTQAQSPAPLRLVQRIPLPGVTGRIDHFTCDVAGKRLFVAALGNGSVEILDLAAGKRAAAIGKLEEPQGLLYEPKTRRLFVATGGDGMCRVYDAATSATSFPLLATVPAGEDADNLRLAPESGQVLVGIQGGLALIDSGTLKKIGIIPFAGHAEAFFVERGGPRVFVNVPGEKQLVVADRRNRAVIDQWPITEPAQNYPIALDEAHQRLFIGCRKPAALQVLDSLSGKAVTRLKIDADTDDLFYDARRARLYVCCGQGAVNVFDQVSPDEYRPMATVPTAPGARTGLFIPDLDRLYVAAPKRGGHDAEILVFEATP